MKILQVNSVYGHGSTGRIVAHIDELLENQGFESYVAYGRYSAISKKSNAIRIESRLGNYVHAIKTRILDIHGFGSKKSTSRFIHVLEELDPDVIHLHNLHGYYINVKVLFEHFRKTNRPIIWTLHDCWPFTGHCVHFEYVKCDRWKYGCYGCPAKKSYPSSWVADNSRANYCRKRELFTRIKNMTLVTPSRWLADLVRQSFLSEYHVKTINNGIDVEIFKPTPSDFRERYAIGNRFLILGVASVWGERKGFRYFQEISKKMGNSVVIVLVGLSHNQKKKLPGNVLGISKVNNPKKLAEIYSAADVFVNPTLEDNFPTVNLEALASGTPVVAFKTGGIPEVISDDCGYVVDKGDLNQLLDAIASVKNRTKHHYMSNCIRKVQTYKIEDKYNEYIELYKKV